MTNVWTDPALQMRDTYPNEGDYGDWPVDDGPGADYVKNNLFSWAHNAVDDLKPTVDEQVSYLVGDQGNTPTWPGKPHDGYIVWPRAAGTSTQSRWATTGPAKAFLGEVMKYKRWLLASAPIIVVEPTPGTALNQANDRIANLETQLRMEQAAHANDMKTVERVLRTQAKRRDWCSEFESVVNDVLNPRLAIPIDSDRYGETMKYRVTWSETYTVTVNRTGEYEVDSEADAMEYAREEDPLTDRQMADEIISNVDPQWVESADFDVEFLED